MAPPAQQLQQSLRPPVEPLSPQQQQSLPLLQDWPGPPFEQWLPLEQVLQS
ncbi:hypothetical protein [Deinococcus hopiensis]|uniref:hypothetical protein n=1 Tax=Deinococcus hopiensis TaxID=309885 RepID=UPI001482A77A|nr:hypothetical protein [Deinococcus hopiensis]